MTTTTILYRFRCRGGTAAAVAALNEIPLARELIFETDTGRAKLGNGIDHYNTLPYSGVGHVNFSAIANGYVLAWNVANSNIEFIPQSVSGGSVDFSTLPWTAQPLFARGAWAQAQVQAGSGGTITYAGYASGQLTTASATGAIQTIATTNAYTRQPSFRYTGSAATAGTTTGVYATVAHMSRVGGFFYSYRGGNADAATVANARCFYGLRAAVGAPANANPSSFTDILAFAADTGDAHMQFMHNDSSGTATKIDLGAAFPANTSLADYYEFQILAAVGASEVQFYAKNVVTGAVYDSNVHGTSPTTNLPSTTTLLAHAYFRNNGTTALATRLDVGGWMFSYNLEP